MLKPRNVLAALAVSIGGLASPALAVSPAQNLFDQASFLVGFYYNGPAKIGSYREFRARFLPQLQAACGSDPSCPQDKAVPVIQAMVASLGDPFTSYRTAAQLEDETRLAAGQGPAGPRLGLIARPQDGLGLVVTDVFDGEPAGEARLQRGDVIATINGQPASGPALAAAEATRAPVQLGISRRGAPQTLSATPRVPDEGRLPTDRALNGAMILRIPDFWSEGKVWERVHQLARKANNGGTKGIVIDLRDADSGYDSEALAAAAAFSPQLQFTYRTRFQGGATTYGVENGQIYQQEEGGERQSGPLEGAQRTTLPVVVLVNRNTVNSAEMFAYFLQSAGRAKVVGEATAGQLGVSGSVRDKLLNGDGISVSELRMYGADGTPFPMQVTPDVVVADDLKALAEGRDPALDAALGLLGLR